MKINDILNDAIEILKKNKIENSYFDSREILLNLLEMDLSSFLFLYDKELEEIYEKRFIQNLINDYNQLINYRANNVPLQYILNEAYFLGLKFYVDERVLIPRFDTEVLVEKVLMDNNDKNKTVLDLCTGSGCIAISLSKLGDFKIVVGSDISKDAIEVASKNANDILDYEKKDMEMNKEIYFLQSDLFQSIYKVSDSIGVDKFDIITANPPYIKTSEIHKLQNEVKNFEPRIALDGDRDGLKFYREIANTADKYLNIDGKIYVEIGFDQRDDVIKIFKDKGFEICDVVKDLNKIDRVIVVKK